MIFKEEEKKLIDIHYHNILAEIEKVIPTFRRDVDFTVTYKSNTISFNIIDGNLKIFLSRDKTSEFESLYVGEAKYHHKYAAIHGWDSIKRKIEELQGEEKRINHTLDNFKV